MKNLTKRFSVAIGIFVASYANTAPAKATTKIKTIQGHTIVMEGSELVQQPPVVFRLMEIVNVQIPISEKSFR